MAEFVFLQGKVRKRTLPVIEAPSPTAGIPGLKRLQLAQGELAQVYDQEEGIRYMAIIELRAGRVRGNHYHKVKREYVYVIDGEALLVVEDIESKARQSLNLQPGDLAVIETGIAHALKPLRPGRAVEFSPARFDPADLYRHVVARDEVNPQVDA